MITPRIRVLPFIFRDLAILMLQSANWQLCRKAWHFWGYTYSERFDIRALFVLFTANLKDSFRPKNGIKSWIILCDYFLQLSTWINLTTVHRWNSNFVDEALSRTSVYRWYGEFSRGRSSLQNEFREGRLKSVVVPEIIDVVHQLILQDRHVTYREIETTLGLSGISIHSKLLEHFTVEKLCSRWIPHNLSIAQKNQSIRVAKVLRQLVQTHAKVYRYSGEYFEKQKSDFR